jgi:hypothetical protein
MTTTGRFRPTRDRDLYLASAMLPVVPAAASIVAALQASEWTSLSGALVRGLTADALLYSAACVVIAAPLAGVAVASGRRERPAAAPSSTAHDVSRLAVATVVFCGISAILTAARLGFSAETLGFVWRSPLPRASGRGRGQPGPVGYRRLWRAGRWGPCRRDPPGGAENSDAGQPGDDNRLRGACRSGSIRYLVPDLPAGPRAGRISGLGRGVRGVSAGGLRWVSRNGMVGSNRAGPCALS